jgi:hypothetical protein
MATIDERYKRGKIYTIRCRYDDTLIYVGSTIDKLAKRFAGHKANRKDKNCSLYQFVDGDWDNFYIELYEDFSCDNKEQLEKREGEVIREIGTINKRIAGRSRKERYKDNRDEILEEMKQYYKDNRDEILDRTKQYYQDNRDEILEYQKQYNQENHDKILERNKKYRQYNRDEILEKKREKCKCDVCGAETSKSHIKRHQKTAKCMNAKK